jgi:hypothetical protein
MLFPLLQFGRKIDFAPLTRLPGEEYSGINRGVKRRKIKRQKRRERNIQE